MHFFPVYDPPHPAVALVQVGRPRLLPGRTCHRADEAAADAAKTSSRLLLLLLLFAALGMVVKARLNYAVLS